jgi:hypothetical protein
MFISLRHFEMLYLNGMGLLESRSRRSAFNIGTAGGIPSVDTADGDVIAQFVK